MPDGLTGAVARAVRRARDEGRRTLLEPEGLAIARELGIPVAEHVVVRDGGEAARRVAELGLSGGRVVVKVVSAQVAHKSDAGGVRVVTSAPAEVAAAVEEMARRFAGVEVAGFSLNRHVEYDGRLGGELLLGLRRTEEFGPVVTLGLGGVLAEFLAGELAPGRDVAVLSPRLAGRERLERILAGKAFAPLVLGTARGQRARLTPAALVGLVEALLRLAPVAEREALDELELNPVALTGAGPVALDALGRLGDPGQPPAAPRPLDKLRLLLEPRSVAIVGVSERTNPARIILDNLLREGFPVERIRLVKPGRDEIAGCRCYPDFDALPERADVAVIGIDAAQVPQTVERIVAGRRAETLILIPGGLGERAGTDRLVERVRASIEAARREPWRGPLVNGGNCLGLRSVPGRFDTLFIPEHKLPRPRGPAAPLAVVSQSGAFAVARLSSLVGLNPRYLVSIGNQIDLTVGDYLEALADDPHLAVLAFYVEGFRPRDGERWLAAAERATAAGKTVVLYRAGRTAAGRRASASHTAAVAGDHVATRELARAAGALVADSLEEFEDLARTACALRGKRPLGSRLGAISNAGFECVAIADNLGRFELARYAPATLERLRGLLRANRLETIVEVDNPLDVTPILGDEAFAEAARAVLDDPGVDVGIVGCVPLTGALETTPRDARAPDDAPWPERSVVERLVRLAARHATPCIAVVDGGPLYDAMARRLATGGVPTFRSADRALRVLNAIRERDQGSART